VEDQRAQKLDALQKKGFQRAEILDLKTLSTLAVGGEALAVAITTVDELNKLLTFFSEKSWSFLVVGGASNLLFPDQGLRVPIVKLEGDFSKIEIEGELIRVGGGFKLPNVLAQAKKSSLRGLEFMAGIPGTVGGAAIGNAGSSSLGIVDLLEVLEGFSAVKGPFKLVRGDFKYGYRFLNLPTALGRVIVTGLVLRLQRGQQEAISSARQEILAAKKKSQPAGPSLGCVFKNPPGQSAGRLIDQMGFKNQKVGGALVSPVHANFIVNAGGAKAGDYLELARTIKRRALEEFGVDLEPEIKILNIDGEVVGLDWPGFD
jgi:UDP-N-acetylmuramate dehydrogenase